MSRCRHLVLVAALVALSFGFLGCTGEVTTPTQQPAWERALAAAGDDGLVVVDFYATWCGPCQRFNAALDEEPALQAALEPVSFVQIDAEKDYGETLAETYGVTSFPTFVVTDGTGAVIDRWAGWGDVEGFVASLDEALTDPISLTERVARFESQPTADDAVRLARIHRAANAYAESIRCGREAIRLDPSTTAEMLPLIAFATVDGLRSDATKIDAARDAARELFASEEVELTDKIQVTLMLDRAAADHDVPDLASEFLVAATAAVAASADESVESMRTELGIAHALTVLDDPRAALEIKRAAMPEGWTEDAGQLNGFAWWCFEHEVNVDEAIELALKGVELAEPGSEKAMILDTVAELCNLGGDCGEAIAIIDRAIEQDPGRDYYKEQRARFEAILAEADGTATTES